MHIDSFDKDWINRDGAVRQSPVSEFARNLHIFCVFKFVSANGVVVKDSKVSKMFVMMSLKFYFIREN